MAKPTPLQIESILAEMGEVGRILHQMGAAEGSAGNLSVGVNEALEFRHLFPLMEEIPLPHPIPKLAGMTFIASGSGCRLRDIERNPTANIGCLIANEGGATAQLFTTKDRQFAKLTSEFNTHLSVHGETMAGGSVKFHAILHGQPPYMTYLSHIKKYQDEDFFNRRLLRWEPETIFQFPQGFGVCSYKIPGSEELELATLESMREHTLVVWAKHGVIARSNISLMHACDRIEYAEAAARYEYLNLSAGEAGSGLSVDEILELCERYEIEQSVF